MQRVREERGSPESGESHRQPGEGGEGDPTRPKLPAHQAETKHARGRGLRGQEGVKKTGLAPSVQPH